MMADLSGACTSVVKSRGGRVRMEIITGVERRRRWRLEEKLRIVAELEQPGRASPRLPVATR